MINPYKPDPDSSKLLAKQANEMVIIPDSRMDPECILYRRDASDEARKFHEDTRSEIIIPFAIGKEVLAVGVMHFTTLFSSIPEEDRQRINALQRRVGIALARVKQHKIVRRKAIKQTEQAHLGLMTAGFSHSLKNSIQNCYAHINDLQHTDLPEDAKLLVARIVQRLDELNKRNNDIREFVLPQQREHRSTKIGEILERLVELFQLHEHAKEITIEVTYPKPDVDVSSGKDLFA